MSNVCLLDSSRPSGLGRLLPALAAVTPLAGFCDMAVKTWPAPISGAGLPLAALGLFLLGVGLTFLHVAVMAPPRQLIADMPARMLRLRRQAGLIGYRNRDIPFDDIARVEARWSDEDGDATPAQLVIHRHSRRGPEVILRLPATEGARMAEMARRLRDYLSAG